MKNWVNHCQESKLATEKRLLSSKGLYCSFLTSIEEQMHGSGCVVLCACPLASTRTGVLSEDQAAFLALNPVCAEKK